jgi:methionyl-tRNA formyltransferase
MIHQHHVSLRKYVFIQDDPFYLPKVLDKYLREFCDSTVGINVQSVSQGKRSLVETALQLLRIYGPGYFTWKFRHLLGMKLKKRLFNDWLRSRRVCYSVAAVADKYGVPRHETDDVNSESFRKLLRERGVQLIVSISGTQFYGRKLRDQTPLGIINCHGGLLPRYRGLMPSFWTLANGERVGGVTVHFVDNRLDNGPIVVQRQYRIHTHDTLEEIMARSKDLAAEAIIDAVRAIESGDYELKENREEQATHYSFPTRDDVQRFYRHGHRFV